MRIHVIRLRIRGRGNNELEEGRKRGYDERDKKENGISPNKPKKKFPS